MLDLTREALHATASEGLVQGPYVAARVGFEPATLWTQGTEPTTEPPCSTKASVEARTLMPPATSQAL